MSKQSADEIEEGEIYESDSDMEIQDVNDGEDEEDFDVAELMTSLFATDNGDTVCTALVGISSQLHIQNKILVKILAQLNSSKN
jgi:hypothetical protein